MSKKEASKSATKLTGHSTNTPVMTRGAVKTLQQKGASNSSLDPSKSHTSESNISLSSTRSNSVSSTDRFELLEKKLTKTLIDVITEKLELFEDRLSLKIDQAIAATRREITDLSNEVQQLKCEVDEVRHELNEIRQANRLSDAVVTGIPRLPDEKPCDILSTISKQIGHQLSPYAIAFRPKPAATSGRSGARSVPLVVKFSSAAEQREFIRKFKSSKTLKLNCLHKNFSSDAKINVFESLTRHNHSILRSALKLRGTKQLHSVFTRNGQIFVRLKAEDSPIHVMSSGSLSDIMMEANNAMPK